MFEKEVTRIFDSKNNLIATLGTEQREKITYDEIPEVLVDAIIATEDSRFFQHNGFDAPRFLKASIQQVLGHGGGGASTLTMQVSKNNISKDNTASGLKGIIRKFTDVYVSLFKIEMVYAILLSIITSLLFVSIGILFGSLCNEKSVSGVLSVVISGHSRPIAKSKTPRAVRQSTIPRGSSFAIDQA